ncbi:MAG: dihydrofolate reductase family protein [Cytophagales bacterium]|nr:dihydrofolate reductase family protein [Cytophagales bacterium]
MNTVFIATSLDGYISDKHGGIDWLHSIPNPDQDDMGYNELIARVDALVMGRTTFETVCGFDIPWPYTIPVYVLSRTMESIPTKHEEHAFLVRGTLNEVLSEIHANGHKRLYIDGGATIQSFLKEDLIDELIISTIPVLLGGGSSLFGELDENLEFQHVESRRYLNAIVQNYYRRKR